MTGAEFKAECKRRGWAYRDAAVALGKSIPSIKLYATDRQTIPDDVTAFFERGDAPHGTPAEEVKKEEVDLRMRVDSLLIEKKALEDRVQKLEMENALLRKEASSPGKPLPETGDMKMVRRGAPKSSLKGSFAQKKR